MADDRRPEIDADENMLERSLRKTPEFFRDYGTYLLLGVIVLAAGWWWYNARLDAAAARDQNAAQALANLTRTLSTTQQLAQTAAFLPPDALARQQGELTAEFDANAAAVTSDGDAGAKSHVLRLRGDFAWTMATLPTPTGEGPPTTRPTTEASTQPAPPVAAAPATRPAADWLADARAAYNQVVEQYPRRTSDNLAALFGLAAVAEQEDRFDDAGGFYDRVLARDDLGDATKNVARQRKALLPMLGVNPRLVAAAPPPAATRPATQPITLDDLQRLLPPASRSATEPAATQPGE